MSTTVSARRHQQATAALAALGDALADHEVLSIQCARSHHIGAVFDTPTGLVCRTVTGPHAHGRKDRADVAHHGATHGSSYVELLESPQADEFLPGWCDCGSWSLSRRDLVADVRRGSRTAHVG